MAVQTTVCDAHDRDYKITVVSNACAASSQESHENSMIILQRIVAIITSKDLRAA